MFKKNYITQIKDKKHACSPKKNNFQNRGKAKNLLFTHQALKKKILVSRK